MWPARLAAAFIIAVLVAALGAQQPSGAPQSPASKVVLLGTGTPAATPERSGPATAIVVNDTAYLVDFGPGVVRRAKPRLLFLYHYNSLSPEELQSDMMKHYAGQFVIGRDLDVY
jgi:hypothetical protein